MSKKNIKKTKSGVKQIAGQHTDNFKGLVTKTF